MRDREQIGGHEKVWLGIGGLLSMILTFSVGYWIGREGVLDSDGRECPVPLQTKSETFSSATGKRVGSEENYSFYETLESKESSRVDSLKAEDSSPTEASRRLLFTVQVGAYQDRRAAEALMERLQAKGHIVYLTEGHLAERGKVYRVRVGQFKEREEAQEKAMELEKEERLPTFVTLF